MSVRAFAAHLGVAVASVTNWERRGEHICLRHETQEILDRDLSRAGEDVRERFEAVFATTNTPTQQVSLPGSVEEFVSHGTPGTPARFDDGVVTAAVRTFRIADSRLGGAPLYSVVVAYLRSHIGPRLVDGMVGLSAPVVFNAAASMLELAGWMAHDRGEDRIAHVHFRRALEFTTLGDDMHLRAHVLGSMSHLAAHDGHPHETIQLARQGQDVLRAAAPHPPLTARLLALEARGAAGLGERGRPLTLLAQAESELAKCGGWEQPPSPWVNHYDQASLASDTGRCLYRLGDLAGTRRQAERIIGLRPPRRARSRSLGQLTLASVLVAQGALDEASAVVEQALSVSLPINSAPVAQGLRTLHNTLRPHRSNAAVAQVHARLRASLQRSDGHPGHGRPGTYRI